MKNLSKIYAVIFVTLIFAIYYIYTTVKHVKYEINDNVESLFVQQAEFFGKNIDEELHHHFSGDLYHAIQRNKEIKRSIEHGLSLLITPIYKYIFVLYRDDHGDYRFLLDGSKHDKAEFGQKLNVNKRFWDRVYETKKQQLINQSDLDTLWITYLHPVIFNDKVEAVIAIDFSVDLPTTVSDTIEPLNKTFAYIFVAIISMLLILLYQIVLNVKNKKESITDPLTKVYNRNYLREFLQRINISKYQIMMLDIDYFKRINDNFGHKAGDMILEEVARIIRSEIRPHDVLIRFGGEEFLVFIKRKSADERLAQHIAQRIKNKISMQEFMYEGTPIHLTISIGINCAPEKFKSVSEAIKYADEMLYTAKRHGRNKIVVEPLNGDEWQESNKKSIYEVKEAFENGRIICYYQPIVSAKSNEVTKYEALIRCIDKNDEVVPPNRFLDAIVNTNLYIEVTKHVIENVFRVIAQKEVRISINMNFSDIMDNTIFEMIEKELQKNKKFASWLIIELLENEKIDEIEVLNEKLKQIKSYGVQIAVDDFGSGYSNYEIFKMLDIDIIKIDGSLVKDIDFSQTSLKITRSIIELSKELGLGTVAEFVHSQEVYDVVVGLGVDEVQGYYLGKPGPMAD